MKENIIEKKHNEDPEEKNISNKAKYISYFMFGFIFIFGITIMIIFLLYQKEAIKKIYEYKEYIKDNVTLSLIILTVGHTVASILFIPGSIFGIASGIIFGTIFKEEGVYTYIGYITCVFTFLLIQGLSGVVVFNISSFLFKKKIREEFIEKSDKLRKLDKVLQIYGAKAIFLFRLSPLVPITIFNYILGGFNISNKAFLLSSFGSFPGELFYCYIGYTAINIDKILDDKKKSLIMILMTLGGGLIILIFICVFAKISQKHFNSLVDDAHKEEEASSDKTRIELQIKESSD